MDNVFESLIYENASGNRVILSDRSVTSYWELRGRSGFSAPEVELITQKYVNGSVKVVGRIIKPRTVSINMIVTGETTAKRDAVFFDMVEQLIDANGGDIGKLYITRTDGRVVILNCTYSSGLRVTDEYRKFHRFTLEFYAEDPYYYSSPYTQEINSIQSDVITLSDDLYLGTWSLGMGNVIGVGTITNPIQQNIEPIFYIGGIRSSLNITNNTTGMTIGFKDIEMYARDVIVIDTREKNKSAYLRKANGSIVSIMDKIDWNNEDLSLLLVPGENRISVSGYGEDGTLVVELMQKYLSA